MSEADGRSRAWIEGYARGAEAWTYQSQYGQPVTDCAVPALPEMLDAADDLVREEFAAGYRAAFTRPE